MFIIRQGYQAVVPFNARCVCSQLGITKLNTTAYHPQCDGLTERFNRTLKTMVRKHVDVYGKQWDNYLHGLLWAYRNTPHEATGEKPSFLLYGRDCCYPIEAAFLPSAEVEMADLADYRQELALTLTRARDHVTKSIQVAQKQYKKYYDKVNKCSPVTIKVRDSVLIWFPQEESGKQRKLSRPWHGPYRVVEVTPTGIAAQREYTAKDDITRVHLNCVTRCPLSFPAGYYWYGDRRHGPGRPPKVVADSTGDQIEAEELDVTPEERDITPEDSGLDNTDDPEVPEGLPEWTDEQEEVLPPPGIQTRTRAIQPPTYYGRSKAQASFQ